MIQTSRHPSVSGDNGVCPVGSVFLLRAAPDVAQQSNPSMAVSATIVASKVGWLVCLRGFAVSLYVVSVCSPATGSSSPLHS